MCFPKSAMCHKYAVMLPALHPSCLYLFNKSSGDHSQHDGMSQMQTERLSIPVIQCPVRVQCTVSASLVHTKSHMCTLPPLLTGLLFL